MENKKRRVWLVSWIATCAVAICACDPGLGKVKYGPGDDGAVCSEPSDCKSGVCQEETCQASSSSSTTTSSTTDIGTITP